MHDKPMAEFEGKLSHEKTTERLCPKCGKGPVVYHVWESHCGGYEDDRYECQMCHHVWWVDGPDA